MRKLTLLLVAVVAALASLGLGSVGSEAEAHAYEGYGYDQYAEGQYASAESYQYSESCEASFYGPGFIGNTTASGSIYTGAAGTAAHPSLPFGTVVHVQSPYGSANLTITDRGPYIGGRCLDVSQGSSWLVGGGVAPVTITVVG